MDVIEISLEVGRTSGELAVVPLGNGLFRVEENPLFFDGFGYGDVVELRTSDGVRHEFVRRVERSTMTRQCFVLGAEMVGSPEFESLCTDVLDDEGHWERVMGGLFFVALPPNSGLNPAARLQAIADRLAG